MYEYINNKKRGKSLSKEEIYEVVEGYTTGKIADYQMSALLMAIYFNGMNPQETSALTMAMVDSGEIVDLSGLKCKTLDKHSTGGVGDKTTLIVTPIVAACGLTIAKMSGRGLGHTGGTIDKLEAIPGFCTTLSGEEFLDIVKKHGLCIAGQSANLAPADKKIYALRDATATVDSIPLIAASIMSKKIAAGAENILLDVKTGSGAFMKTLEGAKELAQTMVDIGNNCGRKTAAIISDMSMPLGNAIGNSLEIIESIQILNNEKFINKRLDSLCRTLASQMLYLAEFGNIEDCETKVSEVITSGEALKKLADMIEAQGGDRSYIENPQKFKTANHITTLKAPKSGYIQAMDTEGVGLSAMALGAGRSRPEENIDFSAGIILHKTTGDYVEEGEIIAAFHSASEAKITAGISRFLKAITFSDTKPNIGKLIYETI